MNIILLGAPGSGKGTLAEQLVEHKGMQQFSTGDIFRKNIAEKTSLGVEAAKYMNQGKLVPDEITNGMVKHALKGRHNNLIFDGYPRTLEQAQTLEKILKEVGSQIDHVVYLDVDQTILLERLSGRLVCPECKRSYHLKNRPPVFAGICDFDGSALEVRPDDQIDKIKIRLEAYETQTAPLIDYYKKNEIVVHLNAHDLAIDEVYKQVIEGLGI
ncbi:adenylate kinase [Williamsoniiplasma luminosum]|uniref:Adenylate kinase n=1 Tax=Williamsoniiplasma luminosum TaxID=214888 RepID=A0A2S0NL05_9MOLU|nr:adenylate kinase [Williamsoniiplasma luminosum]AVP49688.1 MAG: adenylate kinase [Williamsoniiplasma luminosum]